VADDERIAVKVDRDLADLIPGFMQRRRDDVAKLREARAREDLEAIRITGHSMKGTGGGYGFHGLSEIGAAIESAAKARDLAAIDEQVEHLVDYLARVDVEFE